jgi:casein kinase II subunit alpha
MSIQKSNDTLSILRPMTDSSAFFQFSLEPFRPARPVCPEDYGCEFGNIDDYEIVERIGRGKYSTVFSGRMKDGSPCALKVLKPVRSGKVNREIAILQQLKDGPNIPKIFDIVCDQEFQFVTIVMELIENIDFRSLYNDMTPLDQKVYLFNALRAIEFAHSKGIMHRDIKPQNIMIDPVKKVLRLIDWGLADYYTQGTAYQVRVATRHYKSPELLLGFQFYTKSVDIWAMGVTFATMLFRRTTPLFRGRDNVEILVKIISLFGSEEMERYVQKYSIPLPSNLSLVKFQGQIPKGWRSFVKDLQIPDDAMDLLSKMVVIDHEERITAEVALRHHYFDEVRGVLDEKS